MDLATFETLLSKTGQQALADAHALEPTEPRFLACFEKLRKKYAPTLAKSALETVLLRKKAQGKFAGSDQMYFTRESLEQASGEAVSTHRARRFAPFGTAADLCCGIGGDALALARAGLTVHAVDQDSLRLAMLEENARSLGLSDHIHSHRGDALTVSLPKANAAFADPPRRSEERRYLNPEQYTPSLSAIRKRFTADFPLAVKIAPGVAWNDIRDSEAEVEFVSVHGELKECVLWFGPLRSTARQATVLPAAATLSDDQPIEAAETSEVSPLQGYLFDPDPAVVRAGLAGKLSSQLSVSALDHGISLFTSAQCTPSPFWEAYQTEASLKLEAKALGEYLRVNRIGRVTMIKRGSTANADDLMKKLRLQGDEHRTLFLTRVAGKETAIVCQTHKP